MNRSLGSPLRLLLPLLVLPLLVPTNDALAGKKKKKGNAAPLVGWHKEEGWSGECYHPPDFSPMGAGDKRQAWQTTRDAIVAQWRGERGDGVSMNTQHVDNLETVL